MSKVVDVVSDFVDDVVEVVVEAVQDVFEVINDFRHDFNEVLFDALNDITLDQGIFDFALDINTASRGTWDAAIAGDLKAILYIAITGVSLMTGTYAIATNSFSSALSIVEILGSMSNIISTMSSLMITGSISVLEYINMKNTLDGIVNAMNLAFVNSWINGSMNFWMAGGILYDSPKAGDILFNPTGDLNTTKFLNIPNKNSNAWMKWNSGKMHDFQKSTFGNLAGNEFFAVAPLAQRI